MKSRNQNPAELKAIIEDLTRRKTTEKWVEIMEKAGVPCGRIRTIDQVLTDPHVDIREMVVETAHPLAGKVKLIGVPTKLSLTPGAVTLPPPTLGQHTEEILVSLGLTQKEISDLREQGVI